MLSKATGRHELRWQSRIGSWIFTLINVIYVLSVTQKQKPIAYTYKTFTAILSKNLLNEIFRRNSTIKLKIVAYQRHTYKSKPIFRLPQQIY